MWLDRIQLLASSRITRPVSISFHVGSEEAPSSRGTSGTVVDGANTALLENGLNHGSATTVQMQLCVDPISARNALQRVSALNMWNFIADNIYL